MLVLSLKCGMIESTYKVLFELLSLSLGAENARCKPLHLSPEEWQAVYNEANRQSVADVAFIAVSKLPKEERPSQTLLLNWAIHAEMTRFLNKKVNEYAAQLTKIFSEAGRRSAVLKGAANARLYPDPFSRQCGDVDLWVDGSGESVQKLLLDLKLLPEPEDIELLYHLRLPKNENGIVAEIHFRPTAGEFFRNREFQAFMNNEIQKSELVPEGFYSPTIKFALVMQLSHLQHHFYRGGLGLKQYVDYFILLKNSTEMERKEVAAIIKSLYMDKTCGAVMWLLGEIFKLDRNMMLCAPNQRRGKLLLKMALSGGNFGFYDSNSPKNPSNFMRWVGDRLRVLHYIPFDPINAIFREWTYWKRTLPLRIKRRKLEL